MGELIFNEKPQNNTYTRYLWFEFIRISQKVRLIIVAHLETKEAFFLLDIIVKILYLFKIFSKFFVQIFLTSCTMKAKKNKPA